MRLQTCEVVEREKSGRTARSEEVERGQLRLRRNIELAGQTGRTAGLLTVLCVLA